MTTQEWARVSKTLDFILSQQESPGVTGIRGEAREQKKGQTKQKKKGADNAVQNVEQLRLF
jgi:hypothetical protein